SCCPYQLPICPIHIKPVVLSSTSTSSTPTVTVQNTLCQGPVQLAVCEWPPFGQPRLTRACPLWLHVPARGVARSASPTTRLPPSSHAPISSAVMFFAAVLPPCRPNWRAISVIAARTSAGIFTLMPLRYS